MSFPSSSNVTKKVSSKGGDLEGALEVAVGAFSSKSNVNLLTALLVSYGIKHIVVCPGSRNAPLVHNFAECPDIECHLVTDERSAAFVALGMRQTLHQPVAVCVTSGSALLNTLPAVAEATHQKQGIIVISADRPQQWIGQLDGQTLPQEGALGCFVSKTVTLPEPRNDEEIWWCNRLVCEALMEAIYSSKSVHINVPITEPLFDFTTASLPEVRKIVRLEWNNNIHQNYFLNLFCKAKRPMIVIGQMEEDVLPEDYLDELSEKVVVLYEPLSISEMPPCYTDQMLFAMGEDRKKYYPDFVMYIGGNTVSKRLRHFLRELPEKTNVVMVNGDGAIEDVSKHTNAVLVANPYEVVCTLNMYSSKPSAFFKQWEKLKVDVVQKHESYQPEYSSMLAVKMFEEMVDENDVVHYANSTPVRLAAIYAEQYRHCNRGLNGIEGSISTAAGAALALQTDVFDAYEPMTCYCVTGDLSFFYDSNALWQQQLGGNFRILLLNNQQGGIFRQLKGLEKSPVRDSLISAQHNITAEGLCQQFGAKYLCATDEISLYSQMTSFLTMKSDTPVVLEVLTDMDADERAYRNYYQSLC